MKRLELIIYAEIKNPTNETALIKIARIVYG
jgi:hypothetical protein